MSLINRLKAATGKASLAEIVKSSGLSIVFDGNWGEAVMHSGSAHTKLAGEDSLGNKYYEDLTRPYGRHRWVVYNDRDTYTASQVTAQWHAWLHCISDDTEVTHPKDKLKFELAYFENPTGGKNPYQPKGAWTAPEERNWRKIQFWDPSAGK